MSIAEFIVSASYDPNGVFTCYNPLLLRFPMQLMLQASTGVQLIGAIKPFMNQQHAVEYIVVGNRAYIEYIPINMSTYNIPDSGWEIRKFRAKRQR